MSGADHIQRPVPHGYGGFSPPGPDATKSTQALSAEPQDLPRDTDVLCIPAHPKIGTTGDGLELRRLPSGEVVALAFRSPERLVAQLGEYQPWVALPAIALGALVKAMGVERVLIDPILDPGISRWGADHVAELIQGEQS